MRSKKLQSAFLGSDTEFEGKLVFSGEIEINGRFRGEVTASGSLTAGSSADIEADIRVDGIHVHGKVAGNVKADRVVEIFSGGRVIGDIQAPEVILHDGGIFEGTCCTRTPEAEENDEDGQIVLPA